MRTYCIAEGIRLNALWWPKWRGNPRKSDICKHIAELMPSIYGAGEESWECIGQQRDKTSQSEGRSTLNIHWKDWCWSWSSNILVIWCEQTTHWKRPWGWERSRAGEEGAKGWDGWMASLMQGTWTWANFGRWWGTERPGMLQSMASQRVGHHWVTKQQHSWFTLLYPRK